ncbi:MAG: 30S ribosomal protein S8 [Gammaproteobacteria bacterium]|nr:30S ribosomal protein S8 [Gammaproteobacteria bacterium]MCZ6852558.1 30S ribosomal protein S8 [Gammaproteobacteria bacterium]
MTMQDPIADLLTRIRNAQLASHPQVEMSSSKVKMAICQVLKDEGYIDGFDVSQENKPRLNVQLRYHEGRGVIAEIHRVSRPGLRIYKESTNLPNVRGGLGVAVISTSKGLLTDRSARSQGVGGEVLFTVF